MIQPQTLLNVADNSGARKLMCIRVIGAAGNQRYARIGDVIIAVIKDAVPQMPLERSEVIRAVIVRTRKEFKGDDGIIIRYDDNAAVIIDQKGNPKGTRVFGAVAEELRELNLTKIVSLGSVAAAILFPVLTIFINTNYIVPGNYLVYSIILAILVVFNHRENVKRLLNGTENKISFK